MRAPPAGTVGTAMDAKTALAAAFTTTVVLGVVTWELGERFEGRGAFDPADGRAPARGERSWPVDPWSEAREEPPAFDLALRLDPDLPLDVSPHYAGEDSEGEFPNIGAYGYTLSQLYHVGAALDDERGLSLFVTVGDWSCNDAVTFHVARRPSEGSTVRASGESFLDIGPSFYTPLGGLAGTLTLRSADFEPDAPVPFRFEITYGGSKRNPPTKRVVGQGVARPE